MHFAHPVYLLVSLAAGATLVGLYVHLSLARRRALRSLGASHLVSELTASVSRLRRRIKAAMVVGGVMLALAALAGPRLGVHWEQAHRRGVDVLFAIDTSKSMLTTDVKPNRLERAKLAVRDLVQKFPDDRVGLVAFAGSAFLETPLTLDHAIFDQSLQTLDTSVIPLGGTNVASAISTSEQAFEGDAHKKVLVLLTDGEDLSGDALSAAEAAEKNGLVVYAVGVGTPQGELIPLAGKDGSTSFVKDETGQLVTSKLDEPLLRRIATATGGSYRALGDNGQGLEDLYRDELASLPRSDLAARSEQVPNERFQFPLGLALLLLGVEPWVGERRRTKAKSENLRTEKVVPMKSRSRLALASAAAVAVFALAPAAFASPQSAEREYKAGQFTKAQADYQTAAKGSPGDPRLDFNAGSSAYRSGDLDASTKSFESALHTGDLKLQEQAYYNLGDGLYRVGQKTLEGGKTEETLKTWKQAVSDYEAALHLDAADADAKYNRDFVKGKIAELETKNDEQKKKDEDQKKTKEEDQKKKDEEQQKKSGAEKQAPKSGAGDRSKSDAPKPDPKGDAKGDANAKENSKGEPANEAPSKPGELSKNEAKALLDSLRGELQVRPTTPASLPPANEVEPQKDW